MNLKHSFCLAAFAAIAAGGPAVAGMKLMPAGQRVGVAKSDLTIVPDQPWNRIGTRPGRNAESWTLDGISLNDLTFYAGIAPGQPLFKELNKKDQPLPKFNSSMLAPDIAQLFESSYRIANSTSLFEITAMKPTDFAGHRGFHFTYNFKIANQQVKRNGEAIGAVIDNKLYLVSFEAPALHYFAGSIDSVRKIAATASVGAPSQKR